MSSIENLQLRLLMAVTLVCQTKQDQYADFKCASVLCTLLSLLEVDSPMYIFS